MTAPSAVVLCHLPVQWCSVHSQCSGVVLAIGPRPWEWARAWEWAHGSGVASRAMSAWMWGCGCKQSNECIDAEP